jgi:hypothetical protein
VVVTFVPPTTLIAVEAFEFTWMPQFDVEIAAPLPILNASVAFGERMYIHVLLTVPGTDFIAAVLMAPAFKGLLPPPGEPKKDAAVSVIRTVAQ